MLALAERACGRRAGFAAAAITMAGLDLPSQEEEMAERFASAGVAERQAVLNDTFALLRAGSPTGDGVAVVAGAGINCVGVRGERTVRFHSMGRLSGDWGGGYDVGGEALAVVCRAEDGRGPSTLLSTSVPEHFGLTRPLEVTEAVMMGRLREDRLLELSPVVFRAAADGDAPAVAIVHRLADEVALLATTALRRLGAAPPVPVVLGGGLLRARDPLLLARITAALEEVLVCDVRPVVGSVQLALDLLGVPAPAELADELGSVLS